jgi:hypothetical protein
MSRLRIQHLMILVVYVAVTLAWLVPSLRATGPNSGMVLFLSALLTPAVLALLSVLILRPGPYRGWLTAFFLALQLLLAACLFEVPAVLFAVAYWYQAPIGITPRDWGFLLPIQIFAFFPWFYTFRFAKYAIPARCPGCRRLNLVSAPFLNPRRKDQLYFRCGVCDNESLVNMSQYAQGCPSCGNRTLIHKDYSFHWCLNCRTRWKRLPRRTWEDASAPVDDGFYWLHTRAASLGLFLARVAQEFRWRR